MGRSGLVNDSDATSQPLLDAALADLTKRTAALERTGQVDKSTGVLSVEVDSIVGYQDAKHGLISPVIRYLISGDVRTIKTIIVQRDEIINEQTYETLRNVSKQSDITDAQRSAGSVDLPFGGLEPLKVHDVIRVVGGSSDGGFIQNPIFDPTYNAHPEDGSGPADPGYPLNVLLTFTTPALAGTPSKPTFARIIANQINDEGDGTLGYVTLRMYANEGQTLTFDAQNLVDLQVKLIRFAGGHNQYSLLVEDASLLFMDFTIQDLEIGDHQLWSKNTGFDSDGNPYPAPATDTIDFYVGGFRAPESLSLLNLVNINVLSLNAGTSVRIKWRLNQPGPVWPGPGPYRLIEFFVERQLFSDLTPATYEEVVPPQDIRAPQYNTPGDILLRHTTGVVPGTAYRFRLTVTGLEGATRQYVSGSITGTP